MFKISEATEKDIAAIADIAENTWWPTYRDILSAGQIRYMLDALYNADSLRAELTGRTQKFLLLSDEGVPRGFASYGKRREEPAIGKLHKIYVLPQTQKKGYGKALVDVIKGRMLLQDIHRLDLNVNRYNSARFFYEKIGFRIVREEDVAIGPYWMNDYVMRLEF